MSSSLPPMDSAYRDIVDQHAINVGLLWEFRMVVINQPHYAPEALAKLEQRINRHLNALLLQPELAWDIAAEALEAEEPGETFTATLLAFATRGNDENTEKTAQVTKAGRVNAKTFKGLVSALGWLPGETGLKWIQPLLKSNDLDDNHLAIAVSRILSHDPGEPLVHLLERGAQHPQHPLFIYCLRLAGELKRVDLKAACHQAATAENPDIRFWGIWSSVLLGGHGFAQALEPYILQTNPWQQKAIQLAFRVVPDNVADAWIAQLLGHPGHHSGQLRQGIKAIAANGRIHAIPRLIVLMQDDTLARIAGEAFSLLTGIDLKQQQLTRPRPPLDEDPGDIDSALEDAELPWPDAAKVAAQWQPQATDFDAGQRYLMGQPINAAHLNSIIASGYQRQRHAAALELALLEPLSSLNNTHAISKELQ
ncbi:MAG: TIGR02270 family protein [Gammaproteobacteria bacterium]|nr:TIGR02270 family protein [Gammaproteobacteria bacterium]